jgi:hypothetical protein
MALWSGSGLLRCSRTYVVARGRSICRCVAAATLFERTRQSRFRLAPMSFLLLHTLPPDHVIAAEEPVKKLEFVEAELSVILERANIVSAFGDPT